MNKTPLSIIFSLTVFLREKEMFSGTATELAQALESYCEETPLPNVLMKKLIRNQQELLDNGIVLSNRRTHERREISLRYVRDGCVSNDGKTDTGSVSNLLSQPSQPSHDTKIKGA